MSAEPIKKLLNLWEREDNHPGAEPALSVAEWVIGVVFKNSRFWTVYLLSLLDTFEHRIKMTGHDWAHLVEQKYAGIGQNCGILPLFMVFQGHKDVHSVPIVSNGVFISQTKSVQCKI